MYVLYIMSWLSRGVGRYAWPPHSADGFVHSPPVSMPPGARGAPAGPNWCRWGGRSGDFSHVFCTSIMAEACFGTSPIRIVWDFFLLMFKYGKYLPFQKVKKTWHSAMKNPINILYQSRFATPCPLFEVYNSFSIYTIQNVWWKIEHKVKYWRKCCEKFLHF